MLSVISRSFISVCLFSLLHQESEAAVSKIQKVPFFKTPQSQYTSGYLPQAELEKFKLGEKHISDKHYKWNKIYFSINELRPLFAVHLSRYVIETKTNKRFRVLDANTQTLSLLHEKEGYTKKLSVWETQADAYDLGFMINLNDVYLKTMPTEKSKTLTTIPRGTRLLSLNFENNFAEVSYQNYKGYIHLSELITKFDFASFVFADKEWHQVKRRDFDYIISSKGKRLALNTIQGLITPDTRGIIASHNQKIPLWSQVEVDRAKNDKWYHSRLKDHGIVWWKKMSKPNEEMFFLTTDELLKKDISSVSFHPTNPLKGIISADGVYTTQDGQIWKKLSDFESYNGPVHYFNDLLLFVGNFRSLDGGKTFENYIQSDKLAIAIEDQYGFIPKKIQVRKIETRSPYKLKLELETGFRKIRMESPLFAQDWKATKI